MGSLFIVISVPSEEHEKILWIEKNLRNETNVKKISETNYKGKEIDSEPYFLSKSVSDTSVANKFNLIKEGTMSKKQSQSVVYIPKHKNRMTMEKKLEKCLKELKIPNAVWVLGRAGKYYQVSFCTPDGEQCERIIQLLTEHKIGSELNSTVSILPCTLNYEGKDDGSSPNKASSSTQFPPQKSLQRAKETAWDLFVNSVRARMMVAQVVAGVKSNATLTFDFLILLIIASITAAVGLVENSVVILVASMLISPLMGPVMASTFGFATRDWKLQKIGLLNELMGLLLCVVIGFLYGLLVGYLYWESPDFVWPTPEMLNRGNLRSLIVGALIAILSGAAVAIAVLGNYSGSLTGVAISASLMPPAVNAGLLWAVAVILVFIGDTNPQKLTAFTSGQEDPLRELLLLGALSLTLTFINIVCIFLMGVVVLKIKEVTPRGSKDYSRLLWKETIQIARDQKNNFQQSGERVVQSTAANQVPDIFSQPHYKTSLNTWSAYGAIDQLNRPTIQDITAAWYQCTLQPTTSTGQKSSWNNSSFRGTPVLRHPDVTRIWNSAYSSPSSTSCDEHNAAFIGVGTPELLTPQRFVVTPSNITNITS